jgi:hypothetical protein
MPNVRGVFAAAVLLLAGSVSAQPTAPAEQPEKQLSDKEKADDGQRSIGEMRDVMTAVTKLVDDARSERDPLRLNCVNERKTQIVGLVKAAELALEELKAASKERQPEAVDHEYSKIVIAKSKVAKNKVEAEQCIGSLAFYDSDKVERVSTEQADLPKVDAITPEPVTGTYFRPPPASPIR